MVKTDKDKKKDLRDTLAAIRSNCALILIAIFIAITLSLLVPSLLLNQPYLLFISYIVVSVVVLCMLFLVILKKVADQLYRVFYIVFVIILFVIILVPYYPTGNFVQVPDLIGKTQDDAKAILEKEGLAYNISYASVNDSSFDNKVINQSPNWTLQYAKNTNVNLVVGKFKISKININDPTEGSNVGRIIKVTGTFENLKPGQNIYVLIQPQPSNNDGPYEWYVQDPVVISGNKWECNAYVGMENVNKGKFKIVAIITTEDLTKVLKPENIYGFDLPVYEAMSEITVTRVKP